MWIKLMCLCASGAYFLKVSSGYWDNIGVFSILYMDGC